jgi:DNA-binding MarR family transcriptional regulator
MATATVAKGDKDNLRRNEQKWGRTLWAAGWTGIPNVIIEKQAALGLDSIDINIIVHLAQYWWKAEALPFPKVRTIAEALQLSPRTVQKHIAGLEAIGLLKRIERRRADKTSDTNLYSFAGLIKKAEEFAAEKIATRKKHHAEEAARIKRKKVGNLTLIKNEK